MVDPVTGTLATAATILGLIDKANSAFSTLKTAKQNSQSLMSGVGKFLDNKIKVDEYVEQSKKAGKKVDLKVLEGQILLRRRYQELDQFFLLECEGWVYKMWKDMVENAKADDQPSTKENMARAKKARKEDTLMDMIKVMLALIGVILTLLVTMGKELKKVIGNL